MARFPYLPMVALLTGVSAISLSYAQTPPAAPLPPTAPPAAPAQATTLPDVTVPAVATPPAPASANAPAGTPPQAPAGTAAAPAPAAPAPAASDKASLPSLANIASSILPKKQAGFRSSIGNSDVSLFFTPNQIRVMGEALQSYEGNETPTSLTELTISDPTKDAAPEIVEPETYPVFYLSSIVYRTGNDWTVWVSGHKITSRKNTTTLKVISVSPERATFAWAPTYADALATRKRMNMFAPVDAVKNKLTTTPAYTYEAETGVVTFTLKPNQSFVAAYMNTFEGYVQSPALPKITAENKEKTTTPTDLTTPAAVTAQDPSAMRKPASIGDSLKLGTSRSEIDNQLKRQAPAPAPKPAP